MAKKNPSPVSAPARDGGRGGVALLVIDMINRFDFDGGDVLKPKAAVTAEAIQRMRVEMHKAGRPVIYVNDNFGEWHSDRARLIAQALDTGNDVVTKLQPADEDYFIIKPQFSGFYATNLPVLLPKLGVSRLILTGVATDMCVLFTAADAHMRDYALWIPEDGVAAQHDDRGRWALDSMRESMGAETAAMSALSLADWLEGLDEREAC